MDISRSASPPKADAATGSRPRNGCAPEGPRDAWPVPSKTAHRLRHPFRGAWFFCRGNRWFPLAALAPPPATIRQALRADDASAASVRDEGMVR